MKHPKLKLNKRIKLKPKTLRQEIREILDDCLNDIKPYILKDIIKLLKKKGVIYESKKKK